MSIKKVTGLAPKTVEERGWLLVGLWGTAAVNVLLGLGEDALTCGAFGGLGLTADPVCAARTCVLDLLKTCRLLHSSAQQLMYAAGQTAKVVSAETAAHEMAFHLPKGFLGWGCRRGQRQASDRAPIHPPLHVTQAALRGARCVPSDRRQSACLRATVGVLVEANMGGAGCTVGPLACPQWLANTTDLAHLPYVQLFARVLPG